MSKKYMKLSSDDGEVVVNEDRITSGQSSDVIPSYRTSGEWPQSFKSIAKPEYQSSEFRAFVNITKCFVGAASLELPWAFKQGGWLFSFLGMIALALISNYTLWQLARCGHLVTHLRPMNLAPTYPEIGRVAFGTVGMLVAYFGIIMGVLGAVASYFVFIGSSLSSLLCPLAPQLTPTVMTLITLPIITLLSWLRAYRFLAPTSIFGVLALFTAVVLVLVDGFMTETIQPIETYPLIRVSTIPFYLGNAAFVYLIHVVILPTEQSMQKRKHFPKAVAASVGLVTVLNVIFAMLAYFLFGENTQGNVIENLQPGVRQIIVKVALTIDLLATSALFLFPLFELLEMAIFKVQNYGTWKVEILRNVLRTVIVCIACGLAILIPCFSLVTGLSGGFGNAILGLILPPIFFLRLSYKRGRFRKYNRKKIIEIILCIVILIIGVLLFGLSTGFTIYEVVTTGCGSNTTLYCQIRPLTPSWNRTIDF